MNTGSGAEVAVRRRASRRKEIRQWPSDLARPFVPVPMVFLENMGKMGLSPLEALLLIVLKLFEGRDEGVAWPSVLTLANMLGVHARTIQRAVDSLERKHKLLERDATPRQAKKRKTNEYRLEGLHKRLRDYLPQQPEMQDPIAALPPEITETAVSSLDDALDDGSPL